MYTFHVPCIPAHACVHEEEYLLFPASADSSHWIHVRESGKSCVLFRIKIHNPPESGIPVPSGPLPYRSSRGHRESSPSKDSAWQWLPSVHNLSEDRFSDHDIVHRPAESDGLLFPPPVFPVIFYNNMQIREYQMQLRVSYNSSISCTCFFNCSSRRFCSGRLPYSGQT